MENSALRYKIYQALLESDLSDKQREVILEGWFDNLKSWLGAVKDTGATDISKIFANNKFNRRVKVAADNITKEVQDLKSIAKDAGVSPEVALELLNSILTGAGAEPAKIEKAAESPSTGGTGSAETASPKPGSPITASDSSISTIVRAAAAASGKDPEKVVAQAEEKKVDAPKASKALAKAISQQTKTNPEVAEKVINWLIKNNHLLAEGGRRISETAILTAAKKSRMITESISVEKWCKIAGLIVEADDKKEAAKKQFGDFLDDLQKALGAENNEEMSTEIMDILIALDDLDVIEVK